MGCGCKKNKNTDTQKLKTNTVKSNNTQAVKEAINKTVEKYYTKK
mgnify:CR=1|jgi:hypothetical protein|tara:strand:+ start:108 stop:242 length:135 start_codon:yes stop_codon:yes gene_type:complete